MLSVLGVVQYRKRSPRAPVSSSEEVIQEDQPLAEPAKATAIPQSLVEDIHRPIAAEKALPVDEESKTASEHKPETETATREFDLLFWRCGNLLAIETSRDQQAQVDSKHRLTNNIFRAVFGAAYKGSPMYSLSWPEVVASANQKSDKGDGASEDWLRAFLKGQFTQDPQTQLWMMGDDVLELLLSKHGPKEEIQGVRLKDTQLGMEVLVTASLGDMMAKPYLKASVWQLLRTLSPS